MSRNVLAPQEAGEELPGLAGVRASRRISSQGWFPSASRALTMVNAVLLTAPGGELQEFVRRSFHPNRFATDASTVFPYASVVFVRAADSVAAMLPAALPDSG